ncbi:MAG: GMC family oxidoreductase N-terminal domain-containing protein, partial [Ilumatobacteraceae bacterium]
MTIETWTPARGRPVECDVLIIGSGAGGATTAAALAEAGFDVVVAEEGPWVEQGSITPFSLEQMERQYRGGGVTVALGRPSIAYTEGRCAGGGTEVNSGLYRRPPPEVIERWAKGWQIEDFDYGDVETLARRIETDINVVPLPGRATAPSQLLVDGSQRLGWACDESPRWMRYSSSEATSGRRQSMTETYLPRAHIAGARLLIGCRIKKLNIVGRRAISASALLGDETPCTIRFRHVFVCAGAIHSPALLQRSGIRRNIGQ